MSSLLRIGRPDYEPGILTFVIALIGIGIALAAQRPKRVT